MATYLLLNGLESNLRLDPIVSLDHLTADLETAARNQASVPVKAILPDTLDVKFTAFVMPGNLSWWAIVDLPDPYS